MRKIRAFVAGSIGAVALLAASTPWASAAQSGDTETTFTLDGGTIDIGVASNASLPNGMSGQLTVSGQIGFVNVTDNRGGTAGWTTSAASTQFTRSAGGTVSTGVTYNSNFVNKTGDVTVTTSGEVALAAAPNPVVTGSSVTGNNTASWNPMLRVSLPLNSLAGNYSGTITTSVA